MQSTIYAKENFCGHCGESLPEQPKLKNIEDVAPEILKDLKPHYSGARTFTGRVNSSFLYKRRRVDSGNNLTYSYWWLELEDKDGNIERVSVNAENKFYDQLRRGDVLTLFYPTDYTLNTASKVKTPNAWSAITIWLRPLSVMKPTVNAPP